LTIKARKLEKVIEAPKRRSPTATRGGIESPARAFNLRVRSSQNVKALTDRILNQIASGELAVGDQLPNERELAAKYDVPRHSVRKVMDQLERRGTIARYVGRGSFVIDSSEPSVAPPVKAPPLVWSLAELTEARLLFEPELAPLIVERATEQDFETAAACIEAIREAKDWRAFKESKYAFHMALVKAAGNAFIVHIFNLLIESRRASAWKRDNHVVGALAFARPVTLTECEATLDALRSGNQDMAREAIRASLVRIMISLSTD